MRNSNFCREPATNGGRLRKRLACGLAVICLIHFAASAAFALDPSRKISQYVRDKWGTDRGFVGGTVYAICQSADGYLWIGTERGLVRFDGFTFTMIQRPLPDAPPTGPVRSMVADNEGNLWIRLEGPHILLYRDGKFEDAYARFDLHDVVFTATALDSDGGVLLAGLGDQTLRYQNGRMETVARGNDIYGTVISIASTRDRRIWLGTRDSGLYRVSNRRSIEVAPELKEEKINALLPAKNGGLWIGTDHGLKFWDGTRLTTSNLPPSMARLQILSIDQDRDSNLWAGTDHGLVRIAPTGSVSPEELKSEPDFEVTAVYQDRDGDIWFGGSRGIERLRNGMFTTYSTADGLPTESIGPVYVDTDGRTWFGPLSGGLYCMKDGRVESVVVAGLKDDVVYSISGGGGEIWVGRQRGGLTVLTRKGGALSARTYTQAEGLAQNNVYAVHRNRDGTVWAGTVSSGVSVLRAGKFVNYSDTNGLPSSAVNSIVEGYDGTMWLATPNGLASFAKGRWQTYMARDGLPSSNVRTIFEDSDHALWIATTAGLACLSSGRLIVPQGLPDALREQIFGMAEDAFGSLWFSTSDHVIQVNRAKLTAGTIADTDIENYGIGDGLAGMEGIGRERTMVVDPMNRIWVSLNRGLSVADPRITANGAVPVSVRIESMSVGGDPIDWQNPPKLRPGSQNIVLNYAGSNLSVPERIRFRYKLEGSDTSWNEIVPARQVVYSNLNPGTYHFHVVASNSQGLWNGPETVVTFMIQPEFWQTWWFRVAGVAGICLLALAFFQLRMYQLTQRLNNRFQDRLAERTRIAQELHDTLLQGVLSASLQLDVAEDQLPEDSPVKPLLRRILQLMGKVTEEGRNALRGLRAADTDTGEHSLELAFSRMRQEFAPDDTTSYRIIVGSMARPLRPLIRDEVYRIGREAVINAFRHAHAKSIEIELEYAGGYLRLIVRDDGRGIDPQVLNAGLEGHWGLPGMRERSESIGATLKLRSRIGAGTEVELTVPGKIAFESESAGPFLRWLHWLRRERFETSKTDKRKQEKQ